MTAIIWPIQTLYPASGGFNPAAATVAGGVAIGGGSQVSASSQGLWAASFKGVNAESREQILAAHALAAKLEGAANPVIVPWFGITALIAPLPSGVTSIEPYDPVPHSDGSYFSDGSVYAHSPVIVVTASGSAAAGAASISVTIASSGEIMAGMHFSTGEDVTRRLYRIKSVIYATATTATITFWPNLRHAVASGATLDFEKPECVMRLASDMNASLLLDAPHRGTLDIDFVEYF